MHGGKLTHAHDEEIGKPEETKSGSAFKESRYGIWSQKTGTTQYLPLPAEQSSKTFLKKEVHKKCMKFLEIKKYSPKRWNFRGTTIL